MVEIILRMMGKNRKRVEFRKIKFKLKILIYNKNRCLSLI